MLRSTSTYVHDSGFYRPRERSTTTCQKRSVSFMAILKEAMMHVVDIVFGVGGYKIHWIKFHEHRSTRLSKDSFTTSKNMQSIKLKLHVFISIIWLLLLSWRTDEQHTGRKSMVFSRHSQRYVLILFVALSSIIVKRYSIIMLGVQTHSLPQSVLNYVTITWEFICMFNASITSADDDYQSMDLKFTNSSNYPRRQWTCEAVLDVAFIRGPDEIWCIPRKARWPEYYWDVLTNSCNDKLSKMRKKKETSWPWHWTSDHDRDLYRY